MVLKELVFIYVQFIMCVKVLFWNLFTFIIITEFYIDHKRPSSVDHPDYAVDDIIMRCVDDGPSDDRADSISSHCQVIGRRRRISTPTISIDS